MPEFDSYAHGTPCWVDVTSGDLDRSVDFYTRLFGWEAERDPRPEAGGYTMFTLRGKHVAAASAPWQEGTTTSVWTTYLATHDVDDTVARAKAAGGTVLAEPFDVLDAGRMAVLQDPTEAVFGAWQAGAHHGAQLANEPGTLSWNELRTSDLDAATEFYRSVFGCEVDVQQLGGGEYRVLRVGGRSVAGAVQVRERGWSPAPYWSTTFAVADCDDTLRRAEELGGRRLTEPVDMPGIGRFAALVDPGGAAFQVLRSAPPAPRG